jgi:long-subunit fatty acid transport protein
LLNPVQTQGTLDQENVGKLTDDNVSGNETSEKGTHSAFLPNFGYVTPFMIDNVTDFRPDGLQNMAAKNSFKKLNKADSLGGRTDTANTQLLRTEDQTEIAEF